MARNGIGYTPRGSRRFRSARSMRMKRSRMKRKSSLYKKVISIVGKPEIKYTHFTFSQKTGTTISYYLHAYNMLSSTTNLDRRSVSKAFVFPIGGDTGDTRDGNKINMRKVYMKYQVEVPIGAATLDDVNVRVIVFSGLTNPDFTTTGITGFFRYALDVPNSFNQVDQRDFTVWYDKNHLIKAPSYIPTNTSGGQGANVTRYSKFFNVNFKMKGKQREVVFDNDTSVVPKHQEKQQLYIAVLASCQSVSDNNILALLRGCGILYYTDN